MSVFRTISSLGLAFAALTITAVESKAQVVGNDYNYVGVGVGDSGLVIDGKATLTDKLSIRPVVETEYSDFGIFSASIPVTYDFAPIMLGAKALVPFAGAGVHVLTDGGNTDFGGVIMGGVDYHLSEKWIANGILRSSFSSATSVDATIGVGYKF